MNPHLFKNIRFDRNELAGAFGDIGTDFPFARRDDPGVGTGCGEHTGYVRRDAGHDRLGLWHPNAGAAFKSHGGVSHCE